MEQNNTVLGLGVAYLILIFFTFVNAASLRGDYPYYPWIYENWGGIMTFFGCLFLIPVFILTIIFLSKQEETCETVAFGLAIPGWFFIITGSILGFYYAISSYLTPILFFIFVCPQIVLGFGLYAKRDFNTSIVQCPSPERSYGRSYKRRATPYKRSPPLSPSKNRRGNIQIPNEVRIASTMGQSLKRCVRCGNTLDIKTIICYFCGTRQPLEPESPPSSESSSSEIPRPQPEPWRTIYKEQINFCPNCGSEITRGALFCTQCGASLD